ncbi:MAG: hypothetical protein HY075_03150 [Deltaproteobacteria bacterium]|nr:hypothetical protein [Deltaproteobacteria bacterium]
MSNLCGANLSVKMLDEQFMKKDLPLLKTEGVWKKSADNLKLQLDAAEKVSPECLSKIARAYGELLTGLEPTNDQCLANAVVCDKRRADLRRALSYLAAAGLTPDARAKIDDPCVTDNAIVSEELAKMLADDQLAKCVLAPGEARNVEGDMGTSVHSSYALRRMGDTATTADYRGVAGKVPKGTKVPYYEITLNPSFLNDGGEIDLALNDKYQKKMRECFKEANPRLRGPHGEYMTLKLIRDNPGTLMPPVSPITIAKAGVRSDSENWKADIDCPTILHETMHLLGLPDEYREWSKGAKVDKGTGIVSYTDGGADSGKSKYDCRSIGPVDSLMHSQEDAYDAVALTRFLGIFPRSPKRPSLLYPAEFDSIVKPGCGSANGGFYACAASTHETSIAALGGGCPKNRPKRCSKPSWVGKY